MVNYYTILELDEHATNEQLKRSYHRLALRYHPDKAGPEGAARFKEISTAYGVLSDPHKKDVYDRYGEAGLAALNDPVAGGAVATFGAVFIVSLAVRLLFTTSAMILIFLAFLVSHVDGRLTSWTYVKVFSPLFVCDVVLGIPAVVLLVIFATQSPRSLPVVFSLLAFLCAVVLSIVIPIGKDRNKSSTAAQPPVKWRVWLIPGYLFSVFSFLAAFFLTLPLPQQILQLKAIGLIHLANYLPVRFVLSLLQTSCVLVFFVLVGCRADKVITINYFIVVGLPVFVLLTLFLVNHFVRALLSSYISTIPPEVSAAAAAVASAQEERVNGAEAAANAGADAAPSPPPLHQDSPNPMRGGGAGQRTPSSKSNRNDNAAAEQPPPQHAAQDEEEDGAYTGPNPYAGQHASVCGILVSMFIMILVFGLLMASTAMIAVRLNYYHHHATYTGVLSLAKACIPLFIILGVVVLVTLLGSCLLCCGGHIDVDENNHPSAPEPGNREEAAGDATQEMEMLDSNVRTNPARPSEHTDAPGVPHQDAGNTGRPVAGGNTTQLCSTPPARQPDNERLSDVD